MANLNKSALASASLSTFTDNTSGLITPVLHRTYNTNTIDSFLTSKDASSLEAVMLENRSSSKAAANTVDLSTADGNLVHITTGTPDIAGFGTVQAGARFVLVFDVAITLLYNITSLILPTAANIVTAAGDTAFLISEGGGNWRCVAYQRADGTALVSVSQNLQDVTDTGNTTNNDIEFLVGAGLLFSNDARLREGTTDAGLGGAKGIAQICSINYELKWEAGRLYVMEQDGFTIRASLFNFSTTPTANDDDLKGFNVNTIWTLDNGTTYKCTDKTTGAAVWVLQSSASVAWGDITGTLSAQTDLQEALDEKVNANTAITGGTGIKITYDEKGLVLSSAGATLNDLSGVTIAAPTNNQVLTYNDSTSIWENKTPTGGGTGTVFSVALTMPSAFSVANSPVTTSGSLDVTATGTASQYIRGDGVLATLPSGGGGGSSVNYYLNGSITSSNPSYKQLSKVPVIGAGTNFSITGNGLLQQFLTDENDPNRLLIPAGAWNFEMWFNMSSVGGNAKFYVDLARYIDSGTIISIASGSINPEPITGGTSTDLYLTSIAVPETILGPTDRLIVRVYIVDNSGGRTATLHTEDGNLCQVITSFSGGISALNGLTAQTQYFATGTDFASGDWFIDSIGDTHIFNIPSADTVNRGLLTAADWLTFDNKYDNPLGTTSQYIRGDGTFAALPCEIQLAASDETTALTAGTNKMTFRMPYAMTLTGIRASLTTAQASGASLLTVDVNQNGTTILSTKLIFDNTEKTTVIATTQPVISTSALTDDAEITVDIDQIGASGATGLKITLIGTRS